MFDEFRKAKYFKEIKGFPVAKKDTQDISARCLLDA